MNVQPTIRKPIRRIQQNLLAIQERRLLDWLCARMPGWVTPDQLTGIGMVGAAMILAGYMASNVAPGWLLLSIAGYFVHWFGDSMDGSLARFRRIERPNFGYFLDHSCDAMATVMDPGRTGP
jgi:phosphatidylglycerophosphate synthase